MSLAHAAGLATLADIGRLADARGVQFPLAALVVAADALGDVPGIAEQLAVIPDADIVVLSDRIDYAGATDCSLKRHVAQSLSGLGRRVRPVLVGGTEGRVHADEATLREAVEACAGAAIVVTVGSGTMADIGKFVALRRDLPHIIVQSAASVNGFADDQSVLLVDGAKRTTPTRWPDALVIDLDVLAAAPIALNRAGVGDLTSMFSAPADWLLASSIGIGPPYDGELVSLVRPHGARLLEVAGRLDSRNPDDLEFLARMLSISGFTMGLAAATAPSSGLEHVISHLLEMRASVEGAAPALHGEQVGIGVLVATAVWRRLRAAVGDTLPEFSVPDPAQRESELVAAFEVLGQRTARECWSAYAKKQSALFGRPETLRSLRAEWSSMQPTLDTLLTPLEDLVSALRAAGATVRFSELASGFDDDTVRWAVTHGHHMRDRFVVSDLAELLDLWDDDFVSSVLEDLRALGAGV